MSNGPDPKAFLGLGGIALLVSGALCYLPYHSLKNTKQEIAQIKPLVQPYNQVQAQLTSSSAQLVADQNALSHLEGSVSNAAYVPSLLLDLDKYGNQCGIKVTGVHPQAAAAAIPIDPKKKVAVKPYDELTIDVTGTGTFGSALNFIKGLTMFPKIVEVRTVTAVPQTIDPQNPNKNTGGLTITIEIRAFVFKPQDSASPASATQKGGPAALGTAPAAASTTSGSQGKPNSATPQNPTASPIRPSSGTNPVNAKAISSRLSNGNPNS